MSGDIRVNDQLLLVEVLSINMGETMMRELLRYEEMLVAVSEYELVDLCVRHQL